MFDWYGFLGSIYIPSQFQVFGCLGNLIFQDKNGRNQTKHKEKQYSTDTQFLRESNFLVW